MNRPESKAAQQKQIFALVKRNFQKRLKMDDYLKMKVRFLDTHINNGILSAQNNLHCIYYYYYYILQTKREELPMASYRDQVLELVKNHQVVIVSGETGW